VRGWLLAAWLCLPGLASAESWLSDPAESRLAFEARWEGSPVPGEFRNFSMRLQADPGTGNPSSLDVRVEVPSLATELPDVDAALAEPEWFDFARHPQARYRADEIRPLGPGRYRAAGNLSLKGKSRPLSLEFAWEAGPAGARLSGDLVLDRSAFDIGSGEWAAPEPIALEVQVRFDLALRRE
jgi:polyisoprenoid-binding protein YceI